MLVTALQQELNDNIDQVLVFAPNETEKCIQFPVADDEIALEDIETLTFRLALTNNVSRVDLGNFKTAVVMIMDDDGMTYTPDA